MRIAPGSGPAADRGRAGVVVVARGVGRARRSLYGLVLWSRRYVLKEHKALFGILAVGILMSVSFSQGCATGPLLSCFRLVRKARTPPASPDGRADSRSGGIIFGQGRARILFSKRSELIAGKSSDRPSHRPMPASEFYSESAATQGLLGGLQPRYLALAAVDFSVGSNFDNAICCIPKLQRRMRLGWLRCLFKTSLIFHPSRPRPGPQFSPAFCWWMAAGSEQAPESREETPSHPLIRRGSLGSSDRLPGRVVGGVVAGPS